jgi:hypothetical protein
VTCADVIVVTVKNFFKFPLPVKRSVVLPWWYTSRCQTAG